MLHHYYELIRPSALHRYSDPYGVSIWIAPLVLERLVPAVPYKSLYQAHALSTPDITHPIIRNPMSLSERHRQPFILMSFEAFNDAFSKSSLTFVFLIVTCPFYIYGLFPNAHNLNS